MPVLWVKFVSVRIQTCDHGALIRSSQEMKGLDKRRQGATLRQVERLRDIATYQVHQNTTVSHTRQMGNKLRFSEIRDSDVGTSVVEMMMMSSQAVQLKAAALAAVTITSSPSVFGGKEIL